MNQSAKRMNLATVMVPAGPGCWRGDEESHPRFGFASDGILGYLTFTFTVVFSSNYSE